MKRLHIRLYAPRGSVKVWFWDLLSENDVIDCGKAENGDEAAELALLAYHREAAVEQ
jgi:hypothetical protein